MNKKDATEVKITKVMFRKTMKGIYEEALNPVMEKLDRIERKLGMAGTEPECTCHHSLLDCPLCKPHTGPAYITSGDLKKAPGGVLLGKNKAVEFTDIPLRARVAMLDGWENVRKSVDYDEIENPQWVGYRKQQGGTAFGVIPDYDKHVDLAMGALREYCKKNKYERFGRLVYRPDSEDYAAEILDNSDRDADWGKVWVTADTLPQAICEAIAKHAEGK